MLVLTPGRRAKAPESSYYHLTMSMYTKYILCQMDIAEETRANYQKALNDLEIEAEEVERRFDAISRRKQVLAATIQGLREVINADVLPNVALGARLSFTRPAGSVVAKIVRDVETKATLAWAVGVLRRVKVFAGPAEIKGLIMTTYGNEVGYQALYKALQRDSKRPDGQILKMGDKFGLRIWNEGGAS